jgi:hypothetical protein
LYWVRLDACVFQFVTNLAKKVTFQNKLLANRDRNLGKNQFSVFLFANPGLSSFSTF